MCDICLKYRCPPSCPAYDPRRERIRKEKMTYRGNEIPLRLYEEVRLVDTSVELENTKIGVDYKQI